MLSANHPFFHPDNIRQLAVTIPGSVTPTELGRLMSSVARENGVAFNDRDVAHLNARVISRAQRATAVLPLYDSSLPAEPVEELSGATVREDPDAWWAGRRQDEPYSYNLPAHLAERMDDDVSFSTTPGGADRHTHDFTAQ